MPGHLRKRSSFRDQLVMPKTLRSLVINACQDLPASGGHVAFKATFDRVRDRYWWPTMQGDILSHCSTCEACQHRKTPHRRPPSPKGHVPVERPFQRVAIGVVKYKTISQDCKYVMSVIDHLTRFVIIAPIRIHVFLWTEYFQFLVFEKCCILTKVQSSKINLSESYKQFLVTRNSYHTILATR